MRKDAPDFNLTEHIARLDLRLRGILVLTEEFRQSHRDFIPTVQAIDYATRLQNMVAAELKVTGPLRQIDHDNVNTLVRALRARGGIVILMRHGAQALNPETSKLSGPSQKIRMMQQPHNSNDPATSQSLAEAAGTAYILRFAAAAAEKELRVRTALSARSVQVAVLLGAADIDYDTRLNCINYPSYDSHTDHQIEEILGLENNGSLVWDREIVNRLCGEGRFNRIRKEIKKMIKRDKKHNLLTVCVTHTQQTNAADLLAQEPPVRLSELGMRIFSTDKSTLLKDGIYQSS